MWLYKFLDAGAIELVLTRKRIRITTLGKLNDIFDCTPQMPYDLSNAAEIEDGLSYFLGESLGMICYSRHRESEPR